MARSIARVGQLQPIVATAPTQIIDGHIRLEACRELGREPWIVTMPNLTPLAHADSFIRRAISPIEQGELVRRLRDDLLPAGAHCAPGTGRIQKRLAAQVETNYGIAMSPREVAYALCLDRANDDEKTAVEAAGAASMRGAHRDLAMIRIHGETESRQSPSNSPLEFVKRANQLAAVIHGRTSALPLTPVERAVAITLRNALDELLLTGTP